MERVRSHHRVVKAPPDALRSTLVYLRLWKLCDVQLSRDNDQDSARVFDVIPLDEGKLIAELRELQATDLDWSCKPDELREDIGHVLDLAAKSRKTKNELKALEILRAKFQTNALNYSGEIRIASGHGASK